MEMSGTQDCSIMLSYSSQACYCTNEENGAVLGLVLSLEMERNHPEEYSDAEKRA